MPPALLLAAVEPTWTDKEVLDTILKVIGVVVTIGAIAFPLCTGWLRRRARALQKDKANLAREKERLEHSLALNRLQLDKASGELKQMEVQFSLLESESGITTQEADEHRQKAEELRSHLHTTRQEMDAVKGDLDVERRRIERAMAMEGQTWTEKVLSNAPEFKPLEPEGRRMPIISVLNLKGGVGKTTITANLGAALSHLGYRVLLLDLDLQGSLTSLFLSENEQTKRRDEQRTIGNFFAASFNKETPNLLDYTETILNGKSGLVPTLDNLAYAENNLLIRWILRDAAKDPRFLLRKELHLKRIATKFDVVLLDCPPLINISCVNALAASDYVLAPVMPSKQSTGRVPALLQRLKEFRDQINSDLQILGVVANRTWGQELSGDEKDRLLSIRNQARDILNLDLVTFATNIPRNNEVRDAEDEHRPLSPDGKLFPRFANLASEVLGRWPTFCLRHGEVAVAEKEAVS